MKQKYFATLLIAGRMVLGLTGCSNHQNSDQNALQTVSNIPVRANEKTERSVITEEKDVNQSILNEKIPAPTPNPSMKTAEKSTMSNSSSSTSTIITEADARQIVLCQVPGAKNSDIHIYLDRDDGRLVYEGTLIHNRIVREFEIDGHDGTILSWETESIFDD